MIKDLLKGLTSLVYPPNCLICKQYISTQSFGGMLCTHCKNSVKFNIPTFCLKCSRYLGKKIKYPLCKECRQKKPYFDFVWGCCLYEDPIKKLIHKFKYNQRTVLRYLFFELILSFISKYNLDIAQFDTIVPVPLFSTRLRERGYNQSYLLANEISKHFNINISRNSLIKIKNTTPQALLTEKERWTNTQGAFRIKSPDKFKGKAVLIIDDLLTTGATVSEIALTLKESGAQTVAALTLAITQEK
ncbi:MAG: ComF family protein [Candidatus Zapsychrus exili]|nr:ComF family protein [Candidatus Zapsychrus exili]